MSQLDEEPSSFASNKEKLAYARLKKDHGNKCIKAGDWAGALAHYSKGLGQIRFLRHMIDEEERAHKELMIQINLNEALCYLKLQDLEKCGWCVDKVLDEDPKNIKALFRRGMMHHLKNDLDEAKADLEAAAVAAAASATTNPLQLAEIRAELARVVAKIRVENEKQRRAFAGCFEKIAAEEKRKDAAEIERLRTQLAEKRAREASSQNPTPPPVVRTPPANILDSAPVVRLPDNTPAPATKEEEIDDLPEPLNPRRRAALAAQKATAPSPPALPTLLQPSVDDDMPPLEPLPPSPVRTPADANGDLPRSVQASAPCPTTPSNTDGLLHLEID